MLTRPAWSPPASPIVRKYPSDSVTSGVATLNSRASIVTSSRTAGAWHISLVGISRNDKGRVQLKRVRNPGATAAFTAAASQSFTA